MPRVEKEDRGDEIESVRCLSSTTTVAVTHHQRQCEVKEGSVVKQSSEIAPPCGSVRHCVVDCPSRTVQQNSLTTGKEKNATYKPS